MTTLQIFGYLSALLNIICYGPYVLDILKGKTKPQRTSWIIWAVLGSITFFTLLAKGATNSLWLPAAQTVGVLTVLFLSFKRGVGGFSRRDIFTLIAAGIGIIIWLLTKEAAIALYIVIFINVLGSIPTIIKSYQNPESETLITWILGTFAGLSSILSVGNWSFILLIFPTVVFLINGAVVIVMLLGRRRKNI